MKIKLAPLFATVSLRWYAARVRQKAWSMDRPEAGKAKAHYLHRLPWSRRQQRKPLWPNIAGQNAPYLQAQLQGFQRRFAQATR